MIETQVTEWDLPYPTDRRPGAMASDFQSNGGNKLWFVTRVGADGGAARVYNMSVGRNFKGGNARWNSWSLHRLGVGPTGGVRKLKPSHDRRFVFVSTIAGLHKVDTANNAVTLYDNPNLVAGVSDVAVDKSNRVFYATVDTTLGTPSGVITRLNASVSCAKGAYCPAAEVVKWAVGGSVGLCVGGGATDPCLSGVAVHPKYQHLVYFTDNGLDQIGELDTNTSKVRRWTLTDGASGPRQVNVDTDGLVWVIASNTLRGNAHLVSLDPKTQRMTTHQIPTGVFNDPWGVAPDGGMIGYTDFANPDLHKVAMLIPRGHSGTFYVTPQPVGRTYGQVDAQCEASTVEYRRGSPIAPEGADDGHGEYARGICRSVNQSER